MPARRAARKSAAAFIAALVVYLVIAVVTYREFSLSRSAGERYLHTHEVLQECNVLLLRLTQAESAARAFAITGIAQDSEDHRNAAADIPRRLDRLQQLVTDNPVQGARLVPLTAVIATRLEHAHKIVEARGRGRLDVAAALVQSRAGHEAMREIQRQIDALKGEEERLLTARSAALAQHQSGAQIAILGLATIGIGFLVLSWRFNQSAIRSVRLAEAEAHAGRARLLTTLRSCGDGLIVTDDAGHVTLLNPVAQALTGWVEEQARGAPIDQVFHIVNEFTRAPVENPVGRVLREGKVVGLANHTVLIARDGSERPIDDSGAPVVGPDGTVYGVVLVFRDVTSRKQAELARERYVRSESEREVAVRANEAKDNFLALVSHELRSPLAGISGWVTLLRRGSLSAAESARALERIGNSTDALKRLIGDLLDLASINAGKLEVVRSPMDIVELVTNTIEECQRHAREKGVALEARLETTQCLVLGDAQRLN